MPLHSTTLWTTYEIQKVSVKDLGVGLGQFYISDRQKISYYYDSYTHNGCDRTEYLTFMTNSSLFFTESQTNQETVEKVTLFVRRSHL